MNRLKLGLYWAASCGGCEIAVLDLDEKVLDIVEAAEIVFWPVALDFKYRDVETMADGSIDVCLFNGAIRNSEQEHIARLLRAKSKVLVAFGSCACFGGIPGLANVANRQQVFDRVYLSGPSTANQDGTMPRTVSQMPEGELILPEFYDTVSSLNQVVPVEYYLPGCPPPTDLIWRAVEAIVSGQLPPPGSVIASDKTLCDECKRERSQEKSVKEFKRLWQVVPDVTKCFLEQGLICHGPATRGGCGAKCIEANIPCRGCFGPAPEARDQGGKLLGAIASLIDSHDPKETARIVDQIPDRLGTFYRFVLPTSMLRRARL